MASRPRENEWTKALALARAAAAQGTELSAEAGADAKRQREPDVSASQSGGSWLGGSATMPTLADRLAAARRDTATDEDTTMMEADLDRKDESCKKAAAILPIEETSTTKKKKKGLLVLLDMNGTLLVRTKRHLACRSPDCTYNDNHYYLRENAKKFCQQLEARRDIVYCFYTSMRHKSALPATRLLAPNAHIYERTFNKPDPNAENHWDTMRDLEKLWSTPQRPAYGFDSTNTLVIDDTPRKMREHPHNVIVVPTFTEKAVSKSGSGDVLPQLFEYIDAMLNQNISDIRTYIREQAFVPELPTLFEDDDDDAVTSQTEDDNTGQAANIQPTKHRSRTPAPVPAATTLTKKQKHNSNNKNKAANKRRTTLTGGPPPPPGIILNTTTSSLIVGSAVPLTSSSAAVSPPSKSSAQTSSTLQNQNNNYAPLPVRLPTPQFLPTFDPDDA